MPRQVIIQDRNYTEHDLECPDCGARMLLKSSGAHLFYGCERRSENGCRGAHGARRNGSPMGIPGDQATRQARIKAHASFNPIYESGQMGQKEAYIWLQHAMSLSPRDAHIARFNRQQCLFLIDLIERRVYEGFSPPIAPIDIDPKALRAAIEPGMGLMKLAKKLGIRAMILKVELKRNGIVLNRQPIQPSSAED